MDMLTAGGRRCRGEERGETASTGRWPLAREVSEAGCSWAEAWDWPQQGSLDGARAGCLWMELGLGAQAGCSGWEPLDGARAGTPWTELRLGDPGWSLGWVPLDGAQAGSKGVGAALRGNVLA